ncbi:MAG: NUDIX domain-containing protein [Gammaproteobacteria bacterium]|nr:MAG: NUDIX domain-containing protein [Gammaproteobacteria bacterium]
MTGREQRSTFDHNDVEVLDRRPVWQGFFRMDVVRLRHRLFAGGWSDVMQRELFVREPSVVLLPYDPVNDQVVCIEQFRVGALDMPYAPWLLELVAGIIEEGEAPEDVARREADEEAGLAVQDLEFICRYQVSPGGNTEEIVLFCGRVDAGRAGGVYGLDSEHEDIRVHVLDWPDAQAALESGRIRNAAGIIGLQWLMLHRETLRRRWMEDATG